mmetsp:Transcript_114532/g.323833  ORF Transcript_114532/g.323833 Transcript_114532/m.323833 type:complete len:335 (+) Transcript_114532:719-1723(+)
MSSTFPKPSNQLRIWSSEQSFTGKDDRKTSRSRSVGPSSGLLGIRSSSTNNVRHIGPCCLSAALPTVPSISHVTVHSSMRSPSPTCVLCSCSTAFSMFSGILSSMRAERPSPPAPPTKRTELTPPNNAKTSFTCCSDQLAGKPVTCMHGVGSSTSSAGPTSSSEDMSPSSSAASSGASLPAPSPGAGAGAASGACFNGARGWPEKTAGSSSASVSNDVNRSRSAVGWHMSKSRGHAEKCNGPALSSCAAKDRAATPSHSWPSPASTNLEQPSTCAFTASSLAEIAPQMSTRKCPRAPRRRRSERDHEPCTLPSESSTGNAAIKLAASSCVAKRA